MTGATSGGGFLLPSSHLPPGPPPGRRSPARAAPHRTGPGGAGGGACGGDACGGRGGRAEERGLGRRDGEGKSSAAREVMALLGDGGLQKPRSAPVRCAVSALLPYGVEHGLLSCAQPPPPQRSGPFLLRLPGSPAAPGSPGAALAFSRLHASPTTCSCLPSQAAAKAAAGRFLGASPSAIPGQPLLTGAPFETSGPSCTRPLFSSCLAHKQRFTEWALAAVPADHTAGAASFPRYPRPPSPH